MTVETATGVAFGKLSAIKSAVLMSCPNVTGQLAKPLLVILCPVHPRIVTMGSGLPFGRYVTVADSTRAIGVLVQDWRSAAPGKAGG